MNEPTCAIDDCGATVLSRGWCRLHYGRWYRYGDPAATAPPRQSAASTCSIKGCEGAHPKIKLGMCGKHYQRYVKYGAIDLPGRSTPTCDGPECVRPAGTSGLCRSHYKQSHLGKPLAPLLVATKDLGRPASCTFPGCNRPHKARGLCKAHRDHVTKGQELRPVQEYNPGATCSQPGCEKAAIARGLCAADNWFFHQTLRRYGMNADQYAELLAAQGAVCQICGRVNANGNRLSIDHDHACCPKGGSCGRCVRGLLCNKCNLFLGNADDDAARLRKAADYLDQARAVMRVG